MEHSYDKPLVNVKWSFQVLRVLWILGLGACASKQTPQHEREREVAGKEQNMSCLETLERFLGKTSNLGNIVRDNFQAKDLHRIYRSSAEGTSQFGIRQRYSFGLFDKLLSTLQSANGHLHPFMEMENGTAVQARLAVKRGQDKPELLNTVREWLVRYQNYERDAVDLIQKTNLILKNYKTMQEVEKLPTNQFPLDVKLLVFHDKNLLEQDFTFSSLDHIKDYLKDFRKVHWDRFDGLKPRSMGDFKYLHGRSQEQAELFGKLSVLKKELRKFSYYDNHELTVLEKNLTNALGDPELLPPAKFQNQYRLQLFSKELSAYLGQNKISSMTEEMRFNDLYDMGINDTQLSLPKKLFRYGVITFPIQIVAVGVAAVKQYSSDLAKDVDMKYLDREVEDRLSKIENDDEFATQLKDYLELKFKAQFDGTKWNISNQGNATRLLILKQRRDRVVFKEKEKAALLAGDIEAPKPQGKIKILSVKEFQTLLGSKPELIRELHDRQKSGEDLSSVTLEIYARELKKINP